MVSPAWGQQEWDRRKGDCERLLERARAKDLARIKQCVVLWETHRDSTRITPKAKQAAARGISLLYYLAASDEDKDLAYDALRRMGTRRLAREELELRAAEPAVTVSSARHRSALKFHKTGSKRFRSRRYRRALEAFEAGMEKDPSYLPNVYGAARSYAKLGDATSSTELLAEIAGAGGRTARSLLVEARTDTAFKKLRRRSEFKRATGYSELVLLNGAGAEGKQHVQRLKRVLTRSHRAPAFVGTDEHPRGRPLVWYKPGLEAAAREIKDLVDAERTRLKVIDFNTAIDRFDFDIYVVWGMPHKAALLELPKVEMQRQGQGQGSDGSGDPFKAIQDARGKVEDAGGMMKPPELPQLP